MIYVFLAPGFEEIEALATVDILRRAGEQVVTVGVTEQVVVGAHNIPVTADTTIDAVQGTNPDVVVLPGGMPGTLNLERCDGVRQLVADAARSGKWVAAICAAPSVLGHMGLLKDREATCYPGFEKDLLGARPAAKKVCRDGQFITANGPGSALEFGFEIVRVLQGNEKAGKIADAMQC